MEDKLGELIEKAEEIRNVDLYEKELIGKRIDEENKNLKS